jgi:RNase adaptor protein for sRNA GlmZ degradation
VGGKQQVTILSFGWKHGPPTNSLHNFNIKNLPNPSISIRKRKTGLDKELQREFFEDRYFACSFFLTIRTVEASYQSIIVQVKEILLQREQKEQGELVIGIGCHSGMYCTEPSFINKECTEVLLWLLALCTK